LIKLSQRFSKFSKTAGPGILFACTAIGVSHLVQSTRAGADFGLMILGFVILVTLLKYPFFEYGSRYANSTQTSIIDGYKKLGKPALWLYFLLTISSMFFVTGAVGFVTAGFFENLFGIDFLGEWTVVILFAICVGILAIGKYNVLDSLIKIIAIVLLVSTVSAFLFALYNGPIEPVDEFVPKELWNVTGIFFLLALMGWMPIGENETDKLQTKTKRNITRIQISLSDYWNSCSDVCCTWLIHVLWVWRRTFQQQF
jgi:Mn2+/Fe2+ NRAMP family transporter